MSHHYIYIPVLSYTMKKLSAQFHESTTKNNTVYYMILAKA